MNGQAASWAALVVYVVGLSVAFGFRTWSQWRRTGSTGFRGISGHPGSSAWWGGVLFIGALALGVATPPMALTGALEPPPGLVHPVSTTAGLVAAVAGLVVTVAAQNAMGASWRIGVDEAERTELVSAGLFRWIRNPIFTGTVHCHMDVDLRRCAAGRPGLCIVRTPPPLR